ncbi:MAG: porin family protein [Sinimarinibacterium sp.]
MNSTSYPIRFPTAGAALLALVAALAPAGVQAATSPLDEPGLLLGGGIGYHRINSEDFPEDGDDLKDERVGYKGIAGVHLSEIFSIEGQYIDFGTAEDGDNRVDASGWTAGATLKVPVFPRIYPYAKAGALFWDADGRSAAINASDNGTDFTYGVGVQFNLTDFLQLRTEYERFELSDTGVDMGSANLVFSFD